MITALLAGPIPPTWDRELLRALESAIYEAAPDSLHDWHLAVLNDEGIVYRRIIAQSSAEAAVVLQTFKDQGFEMVYLDRQPVMRKRST